MPSPNTHPVLFLKLSPAYNLAWVTKGRTGGVIAHKYDLLAQAQRHGITTVPWGFSCPKITAHRICQAARAGQVNSPSDGLKMLMIYREPHLPIVPDTSIENVARSPNDLPFLEPSTLRDAWLQVGFTAQVRGGPNDRILALADIEEYLDPVPLDLADYTHLVTGKPLSVSMRGSLSHALGSRTNPRAGQESARSKICWVQGQATVYDLLNFAQLKH